MIAALILAATVAGQVPARPAPAQPPAPMQFKAKAKPRPAGESEAQSQDVVERRKARRRAYNVKELKKAVQERRDYEVMLAEQAKVAKAWQEHVYKMGPIWAAENANQVQRERNAIEAERNRVMKLQADNIAWLAMQRR
jgi:hypothetical protein